MTPDAEKLFEQWKRLAYKLAGQWHCAYAHLLPFEDFEQTALIGLWQAAEGFDAAKGVPFPSYMARRVKYLFLDMLNGLSHFGIPMAETRGWRATPEVPLEVESDENGDEYVPAEYRRAAEEEASRIPSWNYAARVYEAREAMKSARFTPREREVMGLVYSEGLSPSAAAERLGLSPAAVTHFHRGAISKLRRAMGVRNAPPIRFSKSDESTLRNHNFWHVRRGIVKPGCLLCPVASVSKGGGER